jgi:DNA modification methylase
MLTEEFSGLLEDGFDLADTLFDPEELNGLLNFSLDSENKGEGEKGSLAEKFGVPPFSVLNAREGVWQDRKRNWLSLGIKSEEGRGEELLGFSSLAAKFGNRGGTESNTSVFDPTLCELCYSWFSPVGGTILDPFAGGSVRGVVASKMGRQYIGHELRKEQVEANRQQAQEICDDPLPVWHIGDSRNIDKSCSDVKADFVFSCPPYADLEVYSDDPSDLSNMNYDDFLRLYSEIIKKSCALLKDDRFACFVVGDVRDKKGNYRNFVGDTVEAFRKAGLHFYNEAILVTAVGSLPLRSGRTFSKSRKLGKTHQNVLVFVKGDGKKAAQGCGDVEVHIDETLEGESSA